MSAGEIAALQAHLCDEELILALRLLCDLGSGATAEGERS